MKIDWHIPTSEWDAMKADGRGWEILIPDWLPMAMNELIRNSWNTYMGERRWIQSYLSQNCRDIPPAMGKRAVQMLVVKGTGNLDDEPNLDGRSKATIDAMVKLKLLRDDNVKWLQWHHVSQVAGPFQKGLVIRLWDV